MNFRIENKSTIALKRHFVHFVAKNVFRFIYNRMLERKTNVQNSRQWIVPSSYNRTKRNRTSFRKVLEFHIIVYDLITLH